MEDNFILDLNRKRTMEHTQNSELLKLYNLIVINQLRPEVGGDIPSKYRNLILNCWNNKPSMRPDLANIEDEIDILKNTYYKNKMVSLNYQLSDRQSKSLSRCLNNDGGTSTYIHSNNIKKEKSKSIWGQMLNNPRGSIMNIINMVSGGASYSNNHSNLRNEVNPFNGYNIPEDDSTRNLLSQNDIEMENVLAPDKMSYSKDNNDNNYTTIDIESGNDTVIIDTNPSTSSNNNLNFEDNRNIPNSNDVNYSYMSSTSHDYNISSNGGDETSMMAMNTNFDNNYYSIDDHENTLIYPDLNLDDIDQDAASNVLEELGFLNIGKKISENKINDPLISNLENEKHNISDASYTFSRTSSYSDSEENDKTYNNYNLAKNYISYNNNKRNTLFAFLETKASKTPIDESELSSSDESINRYDCDIKQLKEKTISRNSIKDDLKNDERNKFKSLNSSIINDGMTINEKQTNSSYQ